MHKRNTDGIKAAAQKKREEALKRTEKAISTLIKEQTPINFNTVSRTANVSTSWLYSEAELCERIKFLRNQGKTKKTSSRIRASDASKDAMIRTLKDKNRKLRDELQSLKSELERVYGKALAADEEAKRFKAEASQLRKRLTDSSDGHSVGESVAPNSTQQLSQAEGNWETMLEELGIQLNPTLRKLIQRSEPSTVVNAIKAFQAQQSTIVNPGGWLRQALTEGWEATEPIEPSEVSASSTSRMPPEFVEWYSKAISSGFLLDQPINLLPVKDGDIQVKICRPDPFGAPYTLSPWQMAKLEWEAAQEINTQ